MSTPAGYLSMCSQQRKNASVRARKTPAIHGEMPAIHGEMAAIHGEMAAIHSEMPAIHGEMVNGA